MSIADRLHAAHVSDSVWRDDPDLFHDALMRIDELEAAMREIHWNANNVRFVQSTCERMLPNEEQPVFEDTRRCRNTGRRALGVDDG